MKEPSSVKGARRTKRGWTGGCSPPENSRRVIWKRFAHGSRHPGLPAHTVAGRMLTATPIDRSQAVKYLHEAINCKAVERYPCGCGSSRPGSR